MKMTVHHSEVSKEKKLLGKKEKTKQKTLCYTINSQCAQIMKSKSISGCSILKNQCSRTRKGAESGDKNDQS